MNRLTFISEMPERTHGHIKWLCKCTCGKEKIFMASRVRSGATRSCGCLRREKVISRSTKHCHAKRGKMTPEYESWRAMIQRCTNPNNPKYPRYGGRNIKVCDRWLVFENFLADMGERPKGMSLDRINNDGNYELGNCRWATDKQQANNRRTRLTKAN